MNRGGHRVGFVDGQFLTAADLADDRRQEARLRGLHTRVVHATWGISLGLDVLLVGEELAISPGLAHDCHGRELVLSEGMKLAIPARLPDEGSVLVVRHHDGPVRPPLDLAAVRVGDRRPGGDDPDPRLDRPLLAWRTLDEVAWGEDVPLAVVARFPGGEPAVDRDVRVYVRPFERPHVGFGAAVVRCTRVQEETLGPRRAFVWRGTVATDDGGFTAPPDYFVVPSPDWMANVDVAFLAASVAVAAPTATSFAVVASVVYRAVDEPIATPPHIDLDMTWFGLQDMRGCPPEPWAWALLADWAVEEDVVDAVFLPFAVLEGGT